jgi:hypothetical protein
MASAIGYISKIILWSFLGSLFLKYLAPFLKIPPTNITAVLGVILLPLAMLLALFWRKSSENV